MEDFNTISYISSSERDGTVMIACEKANLIKQCNDGLFFCLFLNYVTVIVDKQTSTYTDL